MKNKWTIIVLSVLVIVFIGISVFLGLSLSRERNNVAKVEAKAQVEQTIVKKSVNGICHDKSSRYYEATKNYEAYQSIDECLSSGGRLPIW